MQSTPPTFKVWHDPSPGDIGTDHIEFLRILDNPTWITLGGEDSNRSRAIVTLLHGNEPSGLKALHTLIKSRVRPATNIGIFIASVNAALHPPLLSHRFLPDEKDMNRCFAGPYDSDQDRLALSLLETLDAFSPEAVVDAHNTSAHSEPFAVTAVDNVRVRQIARLFTRKLVVIDQSLGTLIEHGRDNVPFITVEFGGVMDPRADLLAEETLGSFITHPLLFDTDPLPLQILAAPLRLELEPGYHVHYSSTVQDNVDVTMLNTIDQLNFSRVQEDTRLGWLGVSGIKALRVVDKQGKNVVEQYFMERDGFLMTKRALTLFMATTDPYIAQKDCLLYLTSDGQTA